MCSHNRVSEEPHHAYGCRLHKTTFWDMQRKIECSEVSMMVQIWQRVSNPLCLGETPIQCRSLEVRPLDTTAGVPPRDSESTPEVTFCRDIVLKNLCLVSHWKHCDRTGQRKISWSTSKQRPDYCVKRIDLAYVSHLVNGKGSLFCKISLWWLHQDN